jgi:hypothetical protein
MNDLQHQAMRDVAEVRWPDVKMIRRLVWRRRIRRVTITVLAFVALAWSVSPNGPALPIVDVRPPLWSDMLSGEDVGPGYAINSWGFWNDSQGGTTESVLEWPRTGWRAAPPSRWASAITSAASRSPWIRHARTGRRRRSRRS